MVNYFNVALLANKQSGKTTLGDMLVEKFGYAKVSFAAPVYQLTESIFDVVEEEMFRVLNEDDLTFTQREDVNILLTAIAAVKRPENKYLKRGFLQGVGDGARCIISDTVWIESALKKALAMKGVGTPVVIDDCRYLNEAVALKRSGFKLVHIERPKSDGIHPSEQVEYNVCRLKSLYGIEPDLVIPYIKGKEKALASLKSYIDSLCKN